MPDETKISIPNTEDFKKKLLEKLRIAESERKSSLIIVSGDLHREVGGYPNSNHRMPNCCKVLRQLKRKKDEILEEPTSEFGATLKIKYYFPR